MIRFRFANQSNKLSGALACWIILAVYIGNRGLLTSEVLKGTPHLRIGYQLRRGIHELVFLLAYCRVKIHNALNTRYLFMQADPVSEVVQRSDISRIKDSTIN